MLRQNTIGLLGALPDLTIKYSPCLERCNNLIIMRVALFVSCLVDLLRPTIAFSTIRLLEAGGCAVCVPQTQTCYGQPAFNSGDSPAARDGQKGDRLRRKRQCGAGDQCARCSRPGLGLRSGRVAVLWRQESLGVISPGWRVAVSACIISLSPRSKGRVPAPQGWTFQDSYASQHKTYCKGP